MNEHYFKTRELMLPQIANRIGVKLSESIASRGVASLVLSGGSSPVPLFKRLASTSLAWEKVTITLADERWVDANDDASNERLIRQTLMQGPAAAAQFVSLKTQHSTPAAGREECDARLRAIVKPFDVVLLGMGEDGHTASLFPGGEQLQEALYPTKGQLCMPMIAPGAAQPRMTLTLPTLLNCRDLILLCTGQSKQDTYKKACETGPIEEMPIRAVLWQKKQGIAFYWSP